MQIFLRFGSVNYLAEVWLNGIRLGEHEGGHLPFSFDLTPHVQPEHNVLVVRVEGELAPDRVPPGVSSCLAGCGRTTSQRAVSGRAWHTRSMRALRTILGGIFEAMTPDGTMTRNRLRLSLDHLLTFVVTLLAVVLAVSYQVVRHLPDSWRDRLLGEEAPEE